MPDITPEIRAKLNLLKTLLGTGKLNEWGESFVTNNTADGKTFVTDGQLNTIIKMHDKLFRGKAPDSNKIERTPRLMACKQATGWQLYVDHKAVGVSMTRIEAERVLVWLEHSLDSLEFVLNKPKPVLPGQEGE